MFDRLFALGLILSLLLAGPVRAEPETFRTPARRYGSFYSVKLTLWRDSLSYVVPVWIRPDRQESSLDRGQLKFFGWTFSDLVTDETDLSGIALPVREFKAERADLAIVPEFAKNCCLGALGRDVLRNYRLRFIPGPPARIEWTKLSGIPPKPASSVPSEWKGLFSIQSPRVTHRKETWDLSQSPFVIDFADGSIRFEGEPVPGSRERGSPLLTFDFLPGSRKIRIRELKTSERSDAARFGLRPGSVVTGLNGEPVAALDRYDIEEILAGRKTGRIEIAFLKDPVTEQTAKIDFDFKKHEFIPTPAVSPRTGRNQDP